MIGAEHQIDRNIHDGKAQRPLLAIPQDSVFHRRDILLRHHAADDRIAELEAGAARPGFDGEEHVAELAVAAGLLLVAALDALDALADGLLVGNLRRIGDERQFELVAQPVERDANVHLALPAQLELAHIGVLLGDQRAVFLQQFAQRVGHLDLIVALFGMNPAGVNRLEDRRVDGAGLRRRRAVRRQQIAGARALQPPERDDLARRRLAHLAGRLPEQRVDAADPPAVDAGAVLQHAAPHPRQRQLAAGRGVVGLEHLRDRAGAVLDPRPRRGSRGFRQVVAQRLEQAPHAVLALPGAHHRRDDQALLELPAQRREHVRVRRNLVLEQRLEQRVVEIGERLEHPGPRGLQLRRHGIGRLDDLRGRVLAIAVSALAHQIHIAADGFAVEDRHLASDDRPVRLVAQRRERVGDRRGGAVELVDEQQRRNLARIEEIQQRGGRDRAIGGGLRHQHDGVHAHRGVERFLKEFERTGAVQRGQGLVHMDEARGADLDAHPPRPGLRRTVGDQIALLDRALARNRARGEQHVLQEGGLAARKRPGERETARAGRVLGAHARLSSTGAAPAAPLFRWRSAAADARSARPRAAH